MADPIRVTAKMLDARDAMRRFWGDRYELEVQPYREAIAANTKPGEGKIDSALRLCKRAGQHADATGEGMILGMAIAAAVDECELPERPLAVRL